MEDPLGLCVGSASRLRVERPASQGKRPTGTAGSADSFGFALALAAVRYWARPAGSPNPGSRWTGWLLTERNEVCQTEQTDYINIIAKGERKRSGVKEVATQDIEATVSTD